MIYDSSVSTFQSCADECACRFANVCPGRRFPGFESFMDVFYGNASRVDTRASEWSKKMPLSWSPPRRRKRCPNPQPPPIMLLDRSLLLDLGRHALAFMASVRTLRHFDPKWESKMVSMAVGVLIVADGNLRAKERTFLNKLAKASRAMDGRPLAARDVYDILLCLRRALPRDATRSVLQFISSCPGAS